MKKTLSLLIVLISLFVVSCSDAPISEPVVWNGTDLTYWRENSTADGGFTVSLFTDSRAASSKDMNTEVLKTLESIVTSPLQKDDYFTYIKDKEYFAIHFIRNDENGGSKYFIFSDDFSVMAVFENLTEQKQDGIIIYPQPAVYSVTGGNTIKSLFEKYDFRF